MKYRILFIALAVLFLFNCAQHEASLYKPFVRPVTCCISSGVPKPVIDALMAGKHRKTVSDNISTIENFDSLGRVFKETRIDPKCHSHRSTLYAFDTRSNISEISCRDKNGKPLQICICGYSIVKLKYDEANRLTEEAAYDDMGQPAIAEGSGSFHRVVYRYQGRRCVAEYFDDAGKIVETKTYHGDTIVHRW